MNTLDAIVDILKREGVEFLSCYPTTPPHRGVGQSRPAPRHLPSGKGGHQCCGRLYPHPQCEEDRSLDLPAHPINFCQLDEGIIRMGYLPAQTTGKMVKITGSVIRYQTLPTRNGKRVV